MTQKMQTKIPRFLGHDDAPNGYDFLGQDPQ